MLCARATLTAGPRHKRYKPDTQVLALVFSKSAKHPDDIEGEAFKPLARKGWKRITINGHKLLDDDHAVATGEGPEAEAFRAALDGEISVVVLGLVQ